MNTYIGKVSSFNGRYWKDTPVRVTASSFATALARAGRLMPRRKGQRIEQVQVSLENLGQIASSPRLAKFDPEQYPEDKEDTL